MLYEKNKVKMYSVLEPLLTIRDNNQKMQIIRTYFFSVPETKLLGTPKHCVET